jgi:glyoxylase-like metal-dependent hydrolase (beta-lactamase superfamily II)
MEAKLHGKDVSPRLTSAIQSIYLLLVVLGGNALAQLEVREVQIGPPPAASRVPLAAAQDRFLAPQAISAVDISADGKVITVGTMAFSHDANVWQFDAGGAVIAKRNLPPWAPMQVATLAGGKAVAAGMAYSRVTSPEPTIWLGPSDSVLGGALRDEFVESDPRDGEMARLRPGAGDWRTGWLASQFGELFVHGPDWLFKPPGLMMDAEGHRQRLSYEDKNLLPTRRALRMAASADGKRAVFGWIAFANPPAGYPKEHDALSAWEVRPNRRLWTAAASSAEAPPLPNPAADFPELAKNFRVGADAMAPATAAAAVAINADGTRIAVIEYAVWVWLRSGPAIGKWDPPIHALNFVPKQRGRLRVFDGTGRELCNVLLPAEGMFEIGFGGDSDVVTCWPSSWFARGVAGSVWLPVDAPARTLYHIPVQPGPALAVSFPDAVADCSLNPADGSALVSCWDGQLHWIGANGLEPGRLDLSAPARLAWQPDGAIAIAGTADGRLFSLARDGKVVWQKAIAVTDPPAPEKPPEPVLPRLPVFQGGRIPKSEHAYVGDIWVIKNGSAAVFVDAAGTSGFATTAARLRALGIERVTHILQTHTHGDHCGGDQLWRATGTKIVAPKSAALSLTWLMPMLTDYGIFPPCPLDVPLPLTRVGDETEFEAGGLKFGALFVPGHSFDLTIYKVELAGRRVAFTGDLGFEAPSDIVHRCWGDAEKARAVVAVIRDQLLPWKPDVVFTGHGARPAGMAFLTDLVRRTDETLASPPPPK